MSAPDPPDPCAWMRARGALAHVRPDLTSEELIAMARDEMTDTHDAPDTDHAAEIKRILSDSEDDTIGFIGFLTSEDRTMIREHTDALAAEHAALVANLADMTALCRELMRNMREGDTDWIIPETLDKHPRAAALLGEAKDG